MAKRAIADGSAFDKCKEIYHKCWTSCIKGCTIFRPNELRQGVLLSGSVAKAEEKQEDAPRHDLRRGDVICCDDTLVGVLVDTVQRMLDVPTNTLLPAPNQDQQKLVSGMCSLGEGQSMLGFDCHQLLTQS